MKKFNSLRLDLAEKTLTPAEKKKREEIAMAMERENPGMPMGKKMAIATSAAKRVAEENLDELKSSTLTSYIDKVSTGPSRGNKNIKAIGGVTTAIRKRAENENPPFEPNVPTGERKDQFGNPIKNVAKHLAKQGMKSVTEEIKTTHEDPLVVTRDSDGNIHTHANLSVANAIHGTDVKHQAIHTGMPVQAGKFTFELSKHHASEVKEAKEKTEYDYEGDMARGQLQSIIMNAQRVHDMLEDNDNLPEWVQSKITLAEDYISTVSNYMSSELDEAALNELSSGALQNYMVAGHKKFDSIRNNTDAGSMAKKEKLDKGIKTAYAKKYPKPARAPAPKVDPNSRGYEKGRYMGDSVEQDDENQIDELKSSTYQSYVNKVTDPKVASKRGNTHKGVPKSIKAIGGVTKAIGKQNFAARLASAASRNF
jgi:hypothetical protein